ncbi:MAG TPA: sigma-70 family RNA polymerase sigma factor [Segetibacter sp.]
MQENKGSAPVKQEISIINMFHVYAPALLAYIIKLVPDTIRAESILQELFTEVSKSVETYTTKQHNVFILLLNIGRNLAIEDLISSNSLSINNTSNRALGINNPTLRAFMERLPLLEKTILALVYYRGLNLNEVSDILHLPLKLVESKMQTASQKFQQLPPTS